MRQGPLAQKLTWREKRWQRRRRRKRVRGGPRLDPGADHPGRLYWAVKAGLNAAGTSPSAIIAGVRQLLTGAGAQP